MAQRQTSLGFASDPTATLTTGLVNDRLSPAGTVPMADSNAWDSSAPPESTTSSGVDPLDPYGVGNARKPLIDAQKHPLKAIGVLLLNMAQGATGRPLYTDKLRERQQEDMQIGVEKMKLMTTALPQAIDMIKKAPANTRMDLAKTYSATIGRTLGTDFSEILMKAAESPDNSDALISRFGKRGQEMLSLAGGDFDVAMGYLKDEQMQGRFDKEENKRMGAQLLDHLNGIDETLDGTPEYDQIQGVMKDGWTLAEARDPLFMRATGITSDMLDVLGRDKDLQAQLRSTGFIPPSDEKLAAEEKIKADNRKPDKPANAQLLTAWNPETKQILSENVLYDPESASLRTISGQPLPPGFVAQQGGIQTSGADMGAVTQGTDASGNPVFFRVPKDGTEAKIVEGVTPPPKVQLGAKQLENARGKLQSTSLARVQLQQIKDKWLAIKDTALSAGPGAGLIPTEAGKAFDKAVDAFRQTNRILTRTPGEGSMSDFETRLAQLALPKRGEWESVTEQSIEQLDDMLNAIETGYTGLLKDATPQPPKNGGDKAADALPATAMKQLEEGKVKTFGNGQSWTLRGGKPVKVN